MRISNTVAITALFLACYSTLPGQDAGPSFEVRLGTGVRQSTVTGRLLVMLSRTQQFRPGENGTPVFGTDVQDLQPGMAASLDSSDLGHPVRSLTEIPAGEYFAQAWIHVYTTFARSDGHVVQLPMDRGEGQKWRRSPGNLFSEPQRITFDPASTAPIGLTIDQVVPPIEPIPDTAWVKRIRIESELLSEFWGQPMHIGATVLLPRGYEDEPNRRYPVVYMQGHFSSRAPNGFREGSDFADYWQSDAAPKMLLVTIQHANPYYDDSYGVNSENLGPYGDAIVTELIPEVEERFRGIGEPYSRALTGGSTGGWIAIAMQVWYPDFFGGTWGFYPDQVDFRGYQVVNILEDDNAYFTEHEWSKVARPGNRSTDGNVVYTMEQENLLEEVIGTRYRSGGQWAVWNAVFGPVAEDGYPKPIWDPITGKIDQEVARWAQQNFDVRYRLEQNWSILGPKLVGKIHVFCGRMDNYYLEQGVYRLEEFLESAQNPEYGGRFEYGDRGGHGWNPLGREGLLAEIAAHIAKRTPKDGR